MERRVVVRGRARAARDATRPIRGPAHVDADEPFLALMDVWFDPATPEARWAVVIGDGADAEAALDAAAIARDLLVVRTGDPDADALLSDLSPVLGRLLADTTPSQRRLARLVLVDGLRQADAADRLGISRASVSVAHARARIHEIGLLLRAVRACWAAGVTMPSARADALTRDGTVPR